MLLLIGGVITCVISAFGVLGGIGKWWALLLIVSAKTMQALSMRVTCVLKAKRGTVLLCVYFFVVCVQYSILLIIVIVLEIVAGVLGFVFQAELVSANLCSLSEFSLSRSAHPLPSRLLPIMAIAGGASIGHPEHDHQRVPSKQRH